MKCRGATTIPSIALLALFAGRATAQVPDSTTSQPQRRPGLISWTSDRRDFKVGDIITILVDEQTIASADKANSDASGRSTDASAGGGMTSSTGSSRNDLVFRSKLDNESNVRGQARRRDVLTTEISARVTAVEANGVMRIEGTRTIRIDKAEQSVTISGMVRAQDVTNRNLVESWRLADAELVYTSSGDLGKPKQSILSRIMGVLWP